MEPLTGSPGGDAASGDADHAVRRLGIEPTGMGSFQGWLVEGAFVEVGMEEEGLRSSRYSARILHLDLSEGRAFVEFSAFFAEGAESDETLLTDWVNVSQLWPPPPPPPPGFFEMLKIGEPLEVYHEDGWWEVTLSKLRQAPNGRTSCLVTSSMYSTERWASLERLRPRWCFERECDDNGTVLREYWRAEAPEGLLVWQEDPNQPDQVAIDGGLIDEEGASAPPLALPAVGAAEAAEGDAAEGNGHEEDGALLDGAVSSCNAHPEDAYAGAAADATADGTTGGEAYDEASRTSEPAASAEGEEAVLRAQLAAMTRLAREYHARICEVSGAALRLFPLAQAAVLSAGGSLGKPECFTRPLPPMPPLDSEMS